MKHELSSQKKVNTRIFKKCTRIYKKLATYMVTESMIKSEFENETALGGVVSQDTLLFPFSETT